MLSVPVQIVETSGPNGTRGGAAERVGAFGAGSGDRAVWLVSAASTLSIIGGL